MIRCNSKTELNVTRSEVEHKCLKWIYLYQNHRLSFLLPSVGSLNDQTTSQHAVIFILRGLPDVLFVANIFLHSILVLFLFVTRFNLNNHASLFWLEYDCVNILNDESFFILYIVEIVCMIPAVNGVDIWRCPYIT